MGSIVSAPDMYPEDSGLIEELVVRPQHLLVLFQCCAHTQPGRGRVGRQTNWGGEVAGANVPGGGGAAGNVLRRTGCSNSFALIDKWLEVIPHFSLLGGHTDHADASVSSKGHT